MNLLVAYYSRPAPSGQGGGVSIHVSSLVVIALCVWALVREYRRITEPKRAERRRLREECEAYGHQWGEAFAIYGEECRHCQRCKAQQHTHAGRWPGEE